MGAATLVKIIDEARTITVLDEVPALMDCNYKDIED